MLRRLLALLSVTGCVHAPAPRCDALPPVARVDRAPVLGLANIQRTMRLLATSSPAQPNRVRILFYGQSITQSAWSRQVATWLQTTYPHAQLAIENRALGGFSSERLLETADTDLYPWQPDLVIFHVYGAHDRYQELIERVRARTSAEVLLQTDHVTASKDLDEPRGRCANPPDAAHWSGFMNQAFLPSLVARNQVALCDLRSAWKVYLREQELAPSALLADEVHLNAAGDQRMAELVESCLRYEPTLESPAEDWVETYAPSARFGFNGHRIDAVVAPGTGITRVRIDGVAPSSLDLRSFARAHVRGGDKWPPLHGVEHRVPLELETFVFAMERRGDVYAFRVAGSRTGDDGEGRTDAAFVSRSGRIVIEPEDWDIPYTFELAGRALPQHFEIELRVEPHSIDQFSATNEERTLTLASGLAPGAHLLELEGDAPLRALTVYRPRAPN